MVTISNSLQSVTTQFNTLTKSVQSQAVQQRLTAYGYQLKNTKQPLALLNVIREINRYVKSTFEDNHDRYGDELTEAFLDWVITLRAEPPHFRTHLIRYFTEQQLPDALKQRLADLILELNHLYPVGHIRDLKSITDFTMERLNQLKGNYPTEREDATKFAHTLQDDYKTYIHPLLI